MIRGRFIGHLSVGVSQVESALVLKNLRLTLLIAFPLLTLIFYWASSFAAARGIAPIHQLIRTATQIDDRSIGTRLPLPPHRDEIYKLAATINDLLHRVENSLKREKQITADISHELRTPLAGIRGTLEVLLRKQREPEQYEQKIEQVLLETDRMNRMLEQLLQLSRLESGRVLPNKEPVALQRFFIAFLEKWQPLLTEKQVVAELNIPPETVVTADAALLELIAGNLLSNALKYGSTGGKINLSWNAATKTLTLTDDGPGIAAEHLPYLFDRFYRTDASRNAKIPGTGLGLSIAKKLADVQGIGLRVESEAGMGTRFLMGLGGGVTACGRKADHSFPTERNMLSESEFSGFQNFQNAANPENSQILRILIQTISCQLMASFKSLISENSIPSQHGINQIHRLFKRHQRGQYSHQNAGFKSGI